MKPFLAFLLATMFYLSANAQVKPIYFIGDSITTDKTKATSYGVSGKLSTDTVYRLKMYDLYDNLMQTGSYKDEKLTIPHGNFLIYGDIDEFNYDHGTTFYVKDKDRFLAEQGDYFDGKKRGRWIQFFPDGKIFTITNYLVDFKHGEFKQFNRRGKVVTTGNYKIGIKDGEWSYQTGIKEIYTDGILTYTKQN
ncbi:MAG: hypothetical protein EOO93_04660 [Pedobacter sp.]|nr:MAG: hypothetical protein EOO93_04660 [Pedobacter sp.]